ncbi:dynein light chain [Echinococcus multilocularis]|uniref:Dynein light chain roadblock n=1 Tax=Echinococcus multilocularis TaxID=6211 RepID=A0A068YEZ3_ECHMU|nr:dynein light chain [Echinococcus multilocularis]
MSRGIPKEGKSEADEIIKRLRSHPGVIGVIVSNREGIAIRTTLENSLTVHYCGLIQALLNKSFSVVKDLDPTNDLTFLRIRSKKNEIMVAPQREYVLIVIQKA